MKKCLIRFPAPWVPENTLYYINEHGEIKKNPPGLTGNTSGLFGNATGIQGDATGIIGLCSYIGGNLDCGEISEEDRKRTVSIDELTYRLTSEEINGFDIENMGENMEKIKISYPTDFAKLIKTSKINDEIKIEVTISHPAIFSNCIK
jgi:hypothetical protein